MAVQLTTYRCGTSPRPEQGLRIGATRRPPRGVPKDRWRADGYFDVWFPVLAPSQELLGSRTTRDFDDPKARKRFFDAYERELMGRAESRQAVELIAELTARIPVSIGCYCEDESRCHRSRLFEIIARVAAERG